MKEKEGLNYGSKKKTEICFWSLEARPNIDQTGSGSNWIERKDN